MSIRLRHVVKDLNIGLTTIKLFLQHKCGIDTTNMDKNGRISDEQYKMLKERFGKHNITSTETRPTDSQEEEELSKKQDSHPLAIESLSSQNNEEVTMEIIGQSYSTTNNVKNEQKYNMEELSNIITSIDKHTAAENQNYCPNKTIGRGELTLTRANCHKVIWIINCQEQSDPRYHDVYREEPYVLVIPKNREYARILLQNHDGLHHCLFLNGQEQYFTIQNSSTYLNYNNRVTNLAIGISGIEEPYKFKTLNEALTYIALSATEIQEKQKELEAATKNAEEEKAIQLQKEIKALQANREKAIEASTQAVKFIRDQVSLKQNPILDYYQDLTKFSNLYNDVAVIIDGGPGTGKTTTMIQRLKLLIDGDDLRDYKLNHKNDCSFTDEQIKIIESTQDNWMFFSPNELLKKYLQDNMSYEGLPKANQHTVVWKTFLNDVIRDDYHLSGSDCPFFFTTETIAGRNLFKGNHFTIINNFTTYFITQIKEKFLRISKIDCSDYEWRNIGKIITSECAKILEIKTLPELIKFTFKLSKIEEGLSGMNSASEIINQYNESVGKIADTIIVTLKKNQSLYEETVNLITIHNQTNKTSNDDDIEDEENNEEIVNQGDDIQLYNQIKPIIRKLALQKKDTTIKLTAFQQQLYNLIISTINDSEIIKITDNAFFAKNIAPALRGVNSNILNPITQCYKSYRKNIPENEKHLWNEDYLKEIVENKRNKILYNQEQALLVGFINEIVRTIYKLDKRIFTNSTHKYIEAYKKHCRPVIGIDEATDYSIIDYWGIKSFGHYEICSYTICGDIMQRMKTDGIRNWEILYNPLLFKNIDIYTLSTSYRQSEKLMRLADKIYIQECGKKSPYKCYLQEENTPDPLWFRSNDISEKAQWIADRVIEIKTVYNGVPTIAIFTLNQEKATQLKNELCECENLITNGITIKVCTDSDLAEPKTLRIFPIDQVKGMEFEAVIFYDMDDIESASLVNRYLYVGLSRASMYLAVTSTGKQTKITNLLKNYFVENGNWS